MTLQGSVPTDLLDDRGCKIYISMRSNGEGSIDDVEYQVEVFGDNRGSEAVKARTCTALCF